MPCRNHPFIEEGLTRCANCAEAFCPDCIVEISGRWLCLPCKTNFLLAIQSGASTEATLPLAGIGARFGAKILDGFVINIPALVLVLGSMFLLGVTDVFANPEQGDPSPLFFVWYCSSILLMLSATLVYNALMIARRGSTVGKKLLGLKVVSPDGSVVSKKQAWIRAVVEQAFGFASCLGLINYFWAFGKDRTALHDLAAKTRVVVWRD